MPPRPAGWSITRLLSVIANWPSRKKASRGVVATQFGLPRPALRNADCVVRDAFLAKLISSSLISNGLRASNLRKVRMSAITYSQFLWSLDQRIKADATRCRSIACLRRLAQHHHQDHSPDRQQRVADG